MIKVILIIYIVLTSNLIAQINWIPLGFNYGGQVNAVMTLSSGNIIVGHSSGVFISSDGGNSFSRMIQTPMEVLSLAKNDTNGYLYAGINSYNNQYGGVYRSSNGINWALCGMNTKRINSIVCLSNGFIFTASSSSEVNMGGVWKSTDNGNSWINSLNSLYDVYCLSSNNDVLLAGTMDIGSTGWGQLLKSVDFGASWVSIGWYSNWGSVRGAISDNLSNTYCVSSGTLRRTTNNGMSWTDVLSGLDCYINHSIAINSLNHLFISSRYGGIWRSINNGVNWNSIAGFTTYSLCLDDLGYLYAGSFGSIYKSSTSTVTETTNKDVEIFKDHKIYQNYPNPFNPVTKIKFDLPKSGFITIKVFDALGREVAVLVNEKLSPGTYETEWNAAYFPSGVYYYKLLTNGFTDTKKMILIK